ncbi:APC family permease [Staphylococcus succinus]|uniref:APC family permease n=1 Tax=Staphylococcus succinus TaxID=61015 RepID=UPI000E684057|nr:APC family permease [Staphylococcus succinus]MEB8123657.1 APC family permease [Staphylococcus succinus]RIN25308.1 amino acid permease [Staphylococcus succinus]RIN44525.1 amino acid permease [Staphylococcus succinus]
MKSKSQFNKTMNVVDVLFLAIGAMLGWGWVVLSGEWVSTAGFVGSIIAFLLGGFLVIVIGLTYAELASAIPETGGGFIFVKKAFSPGIAFISGWSVLFGYVSVITFEAVALPTVIDYVVPFEHQGLMWNIAGWDVYVTWVLIGSVGSILLTSLNYFGVKPAAIMQTVFTIFIVAVGLLLVFGAGFNGDFSNLKPFENGVGGTMSVLMMIPFLFVGFDVIPQIAEEVKAPSKKIGGILIFSIVASVIFYLLIVFGVATGLSPKALSSSNLATADAMVNLFGSNGFGVLLVLGGVAGIITSWNAFIIGGSRILYAMANNGMIPKWFAYIHPKFKTPTHGILFLGILAFVAPLLGRPALLWIVNAGGIGVVLGYLLVAFSFLKLRKSQPGLERPYRIKNGRAVGIIAIILSILFIVIYLPGMPSSLAWPSEWLIVIVWYLIAFVLYFTQKRKTTNHYNIPAHIEKE